MLLAMDDIQSSARAFVLTRLEPSLVREADANRPLRETKAVLLLGTLLALSIVAGAAWTVRRAVAARALA